MTNKVIEYLIDLGISPEHTMEIVEVIEQEQAQDKWIPVSERYPKEEGEEYLVCYDDGTIRIRNLYFTVADNEPYFEGFGQGIVAWMPLPIKPYNAESEDKE